MLIAWRVHIYNVCWSCLGLHHFLLSLADRLFRAQVEDDGVTKIG